jgi:glycosyltransferase involved in cell wall biosynthesis
MIKVCMIVHQYYYRDPRVRRYAEALANAGAQVDVLCPRDQNQSSSEQRDGVRIFTIPLNRGYRGRGSYLLEYGAAFIIFAVRLLALYIKNRYQVIHVHNMPDFLAFTALIPRIFGANLILDIHDPMPEAYMSKYKCQTNSLAVQLMRVQEKLSSMLAHAVITANSNFKDNLVKRGIPADKITVVNNVADPEVFNRNRYEKERHSKGKHFTLIYPGTIATRYGLDVAIRALPLLITRIRQLRLVIIGAQVEYADELATLAEQLGVSSFVQFKPIIPVDEVPRQIIQADVGIYPALPDTHMSIATPCKVLEFAAMGIPVIASRLKVLEDLFGDSALMFFEPGSVEQFARCVLELFDSPARRDELVRNTDNIFVRTHSWSDERRAYFDLLNRLLDPMAGVALDEKDESSANLAVFSSQG